MCECRSHNGFLTAKGLEEAGQREDTFLGVVGRGARRYLDKVGSVSGLELERELYEHISDTQIDEQARRFHNGC